MHPKQTRRSSRSNTSSHQASPRSVSSDTSGDPALVCNIKGRGMPRPIRLKLCCVPQLNLPVGFEALPVGSSRVSRATRMASFHLITFSGEGQ